MMSPLLAVLLFACGDAQQEKTDRVKQDSIAVTPVEAAKETSDTSGFACNCEHKCATKEECLEHCGEECQAQK